MSMNNIKKKKRMNYFAHRCKRKKKITILIEKSEARLKKMKQDKASLLELEDEQAWLNKLLERNV